MADDPLNAGDVEWLTYRYQQLEEEELFWLEKNTNASNDSYRKLDNFSAINLKEQKVISISPTQLIYQKEY